MIQAATAQPRRHVVGFILGSVIVGVVGYGHRADRIWHPQ